MIEAVEIALQRPMSGLASPFPSYINRVYEFQSREGERFVAKFYRPGRWNLDAIVEEHRFVKKCVEQDIPVIPPLQLANKSSIGKIGEILFAVYPKKGGRELELNTAEDWLRLGRVLGRLHLAGSYCEAKNRVKLHPETSTAIYIDHLLQEFIPKNLKTQFKAVTDKILQLISTLFDDTEFITVHGDCHRANILERPGEGLMIIDFDDMAQAPPIQDLWLLLPGYAHETHEELHLLLEGYEQFFEFDWESIHLIEPLRMMRIIYFLTWCSMQAEDFKFRSNFPDWGTDNFWRKEINDLEKQLEMIRNSLRPSTVNPLAYGGGRILTEH
jgi:Ser/Thr protein kinase RdoA (MazF antagonist)